MKEPSKGSVIAYLPERFADWEAGLACAELNKPDAGYRVLTMSADGTPRRSIGGWTVAADLASDKLPDDTRLLMLVGGETWLDGSNDAVLRAVDACVARGIPVAAICGACTFLAQHGYLDACEHTGNAAFEFAEFAPAYRGQGLFRSAPAVDGGAFITANGAASVEFASLVLSRLDVKPWGDEHAWFTAFKRGTFVEG
ncbi:DJ-1/PfpI family protein [Gordonibacter sp. An230]|uniref:DJ-1/PfpI family protein n=1 Tax=Gordonibacter sp. An230 TaxID=1965592 RepID=UPI0013A63D40|nr:DJ-1/PfpI family protein [Gordonibacter sp. An230]